MKSFFLKLLLFALIGAALLLALKALADRAGNVYKDGAAIVCEHKRLLVRKGMVKYAPGKTNILFMGNSKILAGLIPETFDKLSGGKTYSYNLALPALPIAPLYFTLKDYLKTNRPPDYIIMTLHVDPGTAPGLFDKYAIQGIDFPAELLSYVNHRKNKTVALNYFIPARIYSQETFQYLIFSLLKRSNIRSTIARNRSTIAQTDSERGYYYITDQALYPGGRLPDNYGRGTLSLKKHEIFNPYIDPYVKMFFDLCKSTRTTKVILIEPPILNNEFEPWSVMPEQYSTLLRDYPGTILMAPSGWRRKTFPNNQFSDPVHLNRHGATLYTEQIYNEFLQATASPSPTISTN